MTTTVKPVEPMVRLQDANHPGDTYYPCSEYYCEQSFTEHHLWFRACGCDNDSHPQKRGWLCLEDVVHAARYCTCKGIVLDDKKEVVEDPYKKYNFWEYKLRRDHDPELKPFLPEEPMDVYQCAGCKVTYPPEELYYRRCSCRKSGWYCSSGECLAEEYYACTCYAKWTHVGDCKPDIIEECECRFDGFMFPYDDVYRTVRSLEDFLVLHAAASKSLMQFRSLWAQGKTLQEICRKIDIPDSVGHVIIRRIGDGNA